MNYTAITFNNFNFVVCAPTEQIASWAYIDPYGGSYNHQREVYKQNPTLLSQDVERAFQAIELSHANLSHVSKDIMCIYTATETPCPYVTNFCPYAHNIAVCDIAKILKDFRYKASNFHEAPTGPTKEESKFDQDFPRLSSPSPLQQQERKSPTEALIRAKTAIKNQDKQESLEVQKTYYLKNPEIFQERVSVALSTFEKFPSCVDRRDELCQYILEEGSSCVSKACRFSHDYSVFYAANISKDLAFRANDCLQLSCSDRTCIDRHENDLPNPLFETMGMPPDLKLQLKKTALSCVAALLED